jgi:hypothetical protein
MSRWQNPDSGSAEGVPVVSQVVYARTTRSEVPDLAFGRPDGRSAAAAERLLATAGTAWRARLVSEIPGHALSIAEFNCVDINRYSKKRNPAEAMEIHGLEEGRSDNND